MKFDDKVYNLYSNIKIERNCLPEKHQPIYIYKYENTESIKHDFSPFLLVIEYEIFKRDYKYFLEKVNTYNSCIVVVMPKDGAVDEKIISLDIIDFFVEDLYSSVLSKKTIESAVKYLLKFISEQSHQDEISSIAYELNTLHKIGIALSSEKDLNKLLMMILGKAKELTNSDAGSFWIVEEHSDGNYLKLSYSENDTSKSDYTTFSMRLDRKSISGYVADTGKYLIIDNAYDIPPEAEYKFNKSFDNVTGYKTISMLTVPLVNNKGEVLGVIQLLNRKTCYDAIPENSFENYVVPYDKNMIELSQAFASQASVALENAMLYKTLENSFENLVRASISAIESRDPTTSGHTNRIGVYTLALANAVNETKEGVYKDIFFDDGQMRELRYASLLHDIGKIGVRESVLMKSKKLYTEQIEKIKARIEEAKTSYLRNLIEREKLNCSESDVSLEKLADEYLTTMDKYMEIILKKNEPSVLSEQIENSLEPVIGCVYKAKNGEMKPILDEVDIESLLISKGSLTSKERKEMESHIVHTRKFLEKIHWPKFLENVIEIASKHHEYLNGSGYPDGCFEDQIMLQTRIMTIADIYDSLTASDRPYKKSMTNERALLIINDEMENGKLDRELVRIFTKMMS